MGFDALFLGVAAPLPRVSEADAAASVELDYVHFTVVLDSARRFARVTGVNVDGALLVELERGDRWQFDERIPTDWQAGPLVYADNDLDRGHLVRRRDPVWGSPEVAARANGDTFRYTNAAPQASGFNQSKELWLGLEDHVLGHARVHRQRLSVFTAPVLAAGDPPYRGIRVPLRFWKIAAWNAGDAGSDGAASRRSDSSSTRRPSSTRARCASPRPARRRRSGRSVPSRCPSPTSRRSPGSRCPNSSAADRMPATVAEAGWRLVEEPDEILL